MPETISNKLSDKINKAAPEITSLRIVRLNNSPPKNKKQIDYFLIVSLIALLVFACLMPSKIKYYPSYVDWKTVGLLLGLFIITSGLKTSNFFYYISKKMVKRLKYENSLAFSLVSMSAFFSMFLTNDVSVLIIVPLTLNLASVIKNDTDKLIILEIIAANVGSLLSPFGNPQNLYIWHKWHIPFYIFTLKILPLFLMLFLLLFIFTLVITKKVPIVFSYTNDKPKRDRKILITSIMFFILFILSAELNLALYVLPVIIIVYFIFFNKVLRTTNWSLIILFIILFVDIHIFSSLNLINNFLISLKLSRPANLYFSGIVLSQMISNVPATLLLANYNVDWLVLAFSVNIGGTGIIIGSLANIIGLKLADSRKIFFKYHGYSVLYLLLSAFMGFMLVKIF